MIRSLAAVVLLLTAAPAFAAEGMWTFDNFPAAKVKSDLGVDIDRAWLAKAQKAAVKIPGCSASLVSPEGLVLTNAHCVIDCAQDLSTAQNDYVKQGFLTNARSEERTCPGTTAELLVEIADVDAQIRRALAGQTGEAFVRARDAAVAQAERAACGTDQTHRCQVVAFYGGGQYKLYKYRRYSDVKLVFSPEYDAAFFGGDPDNFNFPRYDIDAAFLRIYENGRPLATPDHLRWNAGRPRAGEPVFVVGNPGSTERLLTLAQLETQRDLAIPIAQLQRSELRGRLLRFAEENAEHKRIAADALLGLENSFKVFYGRQFALNNVDFMAAKRREEADLRARVAADRTLAARIGDPWGELEAAQRAYADRFLVYRQMETAAGGGSQLFSYARQLVRGAQERPKPSGERLPEYSDTRLPTIERTLLDAQPVEADLERLYLGFWLSKTREYLTVDAPQTKLVLGRESPEALAERLVTGTKLADPAVRKALWEGGLAAVQASTDPMIQFVLRMDPVAREARTGWGAEVSGPTERAQARIADARFAAFGDQIYPDATGTLRISTGRIEGWTHRGVTVEPFTNFAGLYERATGFEPFELAPRWVEARSRLDLTTPYNIASSNDIIGGNSGSPLINARGEVIGAAFDGNIHSLGGNYGYDPALNRTVTVSAAAITEALDKVYQRSSLVAELTGR